MRFYIGLYNEGISPMWLSGGYVSFTQWSNVSAPQGDTCEGTVLDIENNNWLRVLCSIRYHHIGYICEYPYEVSTTVPKTLKTSDLVELCPPEQFVYNNSCYEFVEDPTTYNWTYAVDHCTAKGGQLVSLETEDEHTAIVDGLTKKNLMYKRLLIGLRYPSDGGSAKWLSGAPLTYDRQGENTSNFKCTTIFAFQSIWFGSPCDPGTVSLFDGYICEYAREITLPSDASVVTRSTNSALVTTERAKPTDSSVIRETNEDINWNGIFISVVIVFLMFAIAAIIVVCRRRNAGKNNNNSPSVEITNANEAFPDNVSKRVTQKDVVPPVYMQLETPDIIRATPTTVASTSLEMNTQPNYDTVDEGGNYYEIRQSDPEEDDTAVKDKFISRNISRAKTVFRIIGRKDLADRHQGKKDIKTNRPQSCKPHYLTEHEGALYAQANLGFSENKTFSLPYHGSSSVTDDNFYHKPIYDTCELSSKDEEIYSLPCTDTLASKSKIGSQKQAGPSKADNFETDHYYSSLTDPVNDQSDESTTVGGVYFVLENPENAVELDNDNKLSREVENEIYDSAGSDNLPQ
ncbi:uncharacterized protein LOC117104163 [Anneissia japonica]|uniref:uncharacterized protein LOC117104163 n=1 Tax=Anneissia japonica TaxID=1529436 RepID=UPI001425855D|nr:uncharacterized protein LOC117104163 [Anneissia japonica]